MKPTEGAINSLLQGTHADPFSILGTHAGPNGTYARAILPGADHVEAFSVDGEPLGVLGKVDERYLFE